MALQISSRKSHGLSSKPACPTGVWSEHDLECLIAGVGILSSGGGGDPKFGRDRAMLALKEGKKFEIVNPCR